MDAVSVGYFTVIGWFKLLARAKLPPIYGMVVLIGKPMISSASALVNPFQPNGAVQNRIDVLAVHALCLEIIVDSFCQLDSALVGGNNQDNEIRFLDQGQADA